MTPTAPGNSAAGCGGFLVGLVVGVIVGLGLALLMAHLQLGWR